MKSQNLIVFLALACGTTAAQAGHPKRQENLPVTHTLHEVVVNSRLNRPIKTPLTQQTVITRNATTFYMPQTSADLLGLTGNVFVQKSQMAGGSPMIRGLATNRLLYTVDGVRMNTAIFRAGNLQNVISLDPFATDNTEVLFGPHSVLYGSDALGGVMNFNTLAPKLSGNGHLVGTGMATMRYATANNERTGHFDIRLGWKKFALVTSFSTFNFGNMTIGSHGPEEYLKPFTVQQGYRSADDKVLANPNPEVLNPTGYHQMNIMQKLLYAPTKNTKLEYAFHLSETSDYPRYDRMFVTDQKTGKPVYAYFGYGPQKWMMNLLTFTNTSRNPLYDQLTLRVADQKFEESRIQRKLMKADEKHQTEKVAAYSANLDLVKTLPHRTNLYYGLEYVYDRVRSEAYNENVETLTTKPTSPRYPKANWQSAAAYVSAASWVTPRLNITAGLRYNYNHINMDFENKLSDIDFDAQQRVNTGALTGNAGIHYVFDKHWTARASFGTGFRTPNVDDFGKTFKKDTKSIVLPNSNIKPEYATNYEVGVNARIGDFLDFDLAVYYTRLSDVIVTDDYTLNDKPTLDGLNIVAKQNGKSANLYGASLAAKLAITENLNLLTHLNYQMGKETLKDGTKNTMPHVAPFFGDVRLQYEIGKLRMELYTMFQAEMTPSNMPKKIDENEDNYLLNAKGQRYSPAWSTLNFKGQYALSNKLVVTMGMENITDARYRVYRSGIPALGRNVVGSVAYYL